MVLIDNEQEILKYLKEVPTGYVTDALRRLKLSGWMDNIYPINNNKKIVGKAATIRFATKKGLNYLKESFYSLLSRCSKDEILVVGALGINAWLFGDNTVRYAINRGLSGLLVDGCIRDTDRLISEDFPIFCKGASVRPYKDFLEICGFQENIICSGTQVKPKDIIVGDSDGVVVIPHEKLTEIIKQIKDIEILEKEQEKIIRNNCSLDEIKLFLKKKKMKKI